MTGTADLPRPEPYGGNEPFIFVSYAHKDAASALPLISLLIEERYRIWYDEGIDPGTEWDANIANHVLNSSFFVALVSENYLRSDNCMDELNYARDLKKQRLLIYLEKCELPPGAAMRMNRIQAIHSYTYRSADEFMKKFRSAPGLDACRMKEKLFPPPVYGDEGTRFTMPDGYSSLSPIGSGGNSRVYRGIRNTGETVAVKVYDANYYDNAPFFRNAEIEKLLMGMRSDCLARVLEIIKSPPCMIQEYVEGETLKNSRIYMLQDARCGIAAVLDILTGLEALHGAGLFYGDLNPDNVMVRSSVADGQPGKCALCDFSSTDFFGNKPGDRTILIQDYICPEKIENKPMDQRSDLYSAGVILGKLTLSGMLVAGNAQSVRQLETIFAKATRHIPEARYQSAREMADDIRAVLLP